MRKGIIFLSLTFILIFSVNSVQAEESEKFTFKGTLKGEGEDNATKLNIELAGNLEKDNTKPELKLNTEKITLKKYHFSENPMITLQLKQNDSEGTIPIFIDIVPNEFFISEKTSMSLAPDQIYLNISNHSYDKGLLTITDNSTSSYIGKYVGSFTIYTEDFAPKKISVEYQMLWDPITLIFITSFGVFIAFILDKIILKIDNKEKKLEKKKKILDHIEHINKHVITWNSLGLTEDSKKQFLLFHDQHHKIAKNGMTLEMAIEFVEHYHFARSWREIDSSKEGNKFELFQNEIASPEPTIDLTNEEKTLRRLLNGLSILVTGLIAIPTTLVGITYFPNHLVFDGILSFVIGISIYSTVEIGKKVRDKKLF